MVEKTIRAEEKGRLVEVERNKGDRVGGIEVKMKRRKMLQREGGREGREGLSLTFAPLSLLREDLRK